MNVIKQRKIWFTVSTLFVLAGVIITAVWGLPLGIDFTGGSLVEIEFKVDRPTNDQITEVLQPLNLGTISVQQSGEQGIVLRLKDIPEDKHQEIISTLTESFRQRMPGGEGIVLELQTLEESRFTSIGPTLGEELKRKTIWAIGIILLAIIIYIAWAFRKVSRPIASWKYGLIAVITLFHDIIITVGVFVVLGHLYGIEMNAAFVAALLTILGYSVNDTIVVFDRTRENLIKHVGREFDEIVEESIEQTITRSINTSLTTLIVLFSILIFGGQTIRDFVLTLIIGIAIGTYSSIFIASPLLVTWQKMMKKN